MLKWTFLILDRYLISYLEMPNNIGGGHAIFMIFQEGSWTNKRFRTLPRGFFPLLCVHITVLFIIDIVASLLTVTHGNNIIIENQ